MDNQPPVLSRRLSGIDAAFLYLERKEIPLNIACVAMFDGPIPFREFVANIDSKLDLIPRYRQVAVPPPFNLGYPTWEYDPNFDIQRHIFRVRLDAPGGEAELEALAGRLLGQILDRGKPLWEIHIVDGLKDGRGALIARIHHALADGVAGAALVNIMFDSTPEGSHAVRKPGPGGTPKGTVRPAATPRAEHTLVEQVAGAIQSALENAVAAEAGLLSLAEGLLSDRGKSALQEFATLLPEWLQPPERFVFNKPCSGDRKFCWGEADLSEVQAIRTALGGKVNDCIVSVVVRAVARYIRLHGEKVNGRFLRVVCPVNLRGGEQGESLGNRITFLPVVLPLDVRDPVEMLHAVASRMEVMKSVRAADLIAIFASCLGTAPAPMQELFWRGLPLLPLPFPLLNMICTNVPGSPSALYTVGRRMVASYPCVPTGYELGVGVAVQSYDGKLFFGLTADAHVTPDVDRLRDYIRISFEELAKAAGVTSANSRSSAPRATTPRAAKPRPAKRTRPARPGQPVEPAASVTTMAAEEPAPAAAAEATPRAAKPAEPVKPSASVAAPPTEQPASAAAPEVTLRAAKPRPARRTKPARPAEPVGPLASVATPAAEEPVPAPPQETTLRAARPAEPVEPWASVTTPAAEEPAPAAAPEATIRVAKPRPARRTQPARPVESSPSVATPAAEEPAPVPPQETALRAARPAEPVEPAASVAAPPTEEPAPATAPQATIRVAKPRPARRTKPAGPVESSPSVATPPPEEPEAAPPQEAAPRSAKPRPAKRTQPARLWEPVEPWAPVATPAAGAPAPAAARAATAAPQADEFTADQEEAGWEEPVLV